MEIRNGGNAAWDSFNQSRQLAQNQQQQEAGMLTQLIQLKRQEEDRAKQGQYEAAVGALGPDATPEQMIGAARPFMKPDALARMVQGSQDRNALLKSKEMEGANSREQRLYEIERNGQLALERVREQAREQRITKEEAASRDATIRESMARLAASLRPAPAPQPVTPVTIQNPDDPNSTIVIDGRTREVLGKGPKLTETGKSNFKQMTTMQGIASDLRQAEDLLMGQVRDSEGNVTKGNLPTGSGFGSLVDSTAGFFGMSPSGAEEADALKVVSGKLVQKVPRFEGPQSDKDVALYKAMAADAGDEKKPRARRLAAVQKMREIYSGYEDGSRGRLVQENLSGGNYPNGTDRRVNDEPPPGAVRLRGR